MREAARGIAVFIGLVGAAITVLPFAMWLRRRKAAAALYAEFREAVPRVIGFRYRRQKMIFGDGFLDAYDGQIGEISYRLEVEIIPHRRLRGYRLRLEKRVGGEALVYETSACADPAGPDPLARAAAALRRVRAKREGYCISEAS